MLDDPAVLDRAMAGAHAVVHLAAATRTSDPVEARRVNVAGTRALVQSARADGVCRMVVLSTVTVHRDLVGAYGATKREMEAVIDAAGVDAVILRPSLVYGPGAFGLFHRMTELVRALQVVPIIGPGDDRLRPVHVDDVVAAIVTSLDPSRAAGPSYDLVGPDEVTMEEFLGRIEAVYGLRRRHLHVPVPLARAGARGLAKVMREPPVSMDNIVGTGQPTPHDPEPARRDLGLPSIGLRRGLPTVTDPPPWVARHGRPVRVVVVGLWKMGVAHTALLSMVPGARVAAVVDPDAGLGKVVRGIGFGAPWFASLEAAVDATAPDAVVIATPTHTHPDLVVTAARHGAAVLVEKPLAHTLGAALIMADAVNIAGVTASCGYTLGYLPSFERAHDLLAGGVVGEIRRFRGTMYISQVFGPKQGWMYDPARSGGGVAANVGSHLLFLLHWYFGAASEVSATTSGRHTMAEDQANIALRFAGGVEGDVEMSWSMPGYPLSATAIRPGRCRREGPSSTRPGCVTPPCSTSAARATTGRTRTSSVRWATAIRCGRRWRGRSRSSGCSTPFTGRPQGEGRPSCCTGTSWPRRPNRDHPAHPWLGTAARARSVFTVR